MTPREGLQALYPSPAASGERTGYPLRRRIRLVGLGRTLGKRVGGNPSRVRISHPPPVRTPGEVSAPVSADTATPVGYSEPPGLSRGTGTAAALGLSLTLLFAVAALGASDVEPRLPGAGHLPPWTLLGAKPDPLGVVFLTVVALVLGGVAARVRRPGHGARLAAATLPPVRRRGAGRRRAVPGAGHRIGRPRELCRVRAHGRARTRPLHHIPRAAGRDRRPGRRGGRGPLEEHAFGLRAAGHRGATLRLLDRRTIGAHHRRRPVRHQRDRASSSPGCSSTSPPAARSGRRRAALLWMLNPLMLFELVSGAHIDCLVTLFAVAGVVAGVALAARGRASCWVVRPRSSCRRWRSWPVWSGPRARSLARHRRPGVGAASVTLALAYSTVSVHALGRSLQAGKLASWATPWRAGISLLDATVRSAGVPYDHVSGRGGDRGRVRRCPAA